LLFYNSMPDRGGVGGDQGAKQRNLLID